MTSYETTNALTVFLYLLLRDKLTAGEAEEMVRQVELGKSKVNQLSNVHVAAFAEELSQRLSAPGTAATREP